MQLPLPADVLIPLGIGAIVAVVAAVVLVVGLRLRSDDSPAPTHTDWTGENLGTRPTGRPPSASARTVADAIAARHVDTDPFPVVPAMAVAAASGPGTAKSRRSARAAGDGDHEQAALVAAVKDAPGVPALAGKPPDGIPQAVGDHRLATTPRGYIPRVATAGRPVGTPDGNRAAAGPPEGGEVVGLQAAPAVPTPIAEGTDLSTPAHDHQLGASNGRFRPHLRPSGDHRRGDDGEPAGPAAEPTGPAHAAEPKGYAVADPSAADPSAADPSVACHAPELAQPALTAEHRQGVGHPAPEQAAPAADHRLGAPGGDVWADLWSSGDHRVERAAAPPAPAPAPAERPGPRYAADDQPAADRARVGHPGPHGATDDQPAPDRPGPGHPGPDHPSAQPPSPASPVGSSRTVAAAVAHVLAARAAVPGTDRRADARDRLLAALLDDPLRAVGATVDLQDCRERIDSLSGALRDERARLGEVLARLAGSGLRSDQLARLSGLSDADVDELLRRNLAG